MNPSNLHAVFVHFRTHIYRFQLALEQLNVVFDMLLCPTDQRAGEPVLKAAVVGLGRVLDQRELDQCYLRDVQSYVALEADLSILSFRWKDWVCVDGGGTWCAF